MSALSPQRSAARAALGAAHAQAQRRPGDPAARAQAEERTREYRYVSAEEYIAALVAAAPPLTAAQRDRLACLLRGGTPA